ncbi:MAG: hypothetical protein IT381_30165 [Deltaproteobacteria bacterium]|nr:hypothetical protein [Deltaproteobacteria bacterium]
MTKLLQDFTAAKQARVWNVGGDGKEFGATEAFGSDMPRSPRDDEGRLIAGPGARVVPLDEEALRGRYTAGKPVRRVPIEPRQTKPRRERFSVVMPAAAPIRPRKHALG